MKRAVYDKQFKMAAVKHAQSEDQFVNEVAKALGISATTLRRWINEYDELEKVRFVGMETHFLIRLLKLRNCKSKTKNYEWRTSC